MTYQIKPVYTPPAKINKSLYTEGKEWSDAITFEEHVGLYHSYPNGAVYTEASYMPGVSKPLVPYIVQGEETNTLDSNGQDAGVVSNNNSLYYKITQSRFHKHYPPPYYYPQPTERDYNKGHFSRIIVQKINDYSDITEISPDESRRINNKNNPGIDEALYKVANIEWTIDGPINEVRAANQRIIAEIIQRLDFQGLDKYLSDLDEFHKDFHKIPE